MTGCSHNAPSRFIMGERGKNKNIRVCYVFLFSYLDIRKHSSDVFAFSGNVDHRTTAAALRSGVPTIVTPCIVDQFDNAALVESSGCGIGFKKPLRKISEKQLADAMTQCTNGKNSAMLSNCQRISEALEKEDGVANAVREIDVFLKEKVDTGEWKKDCEARLEQRAQAPWSTLRAIYRLMFYKEPFVEK